MAHSSKFPSSQELRQEILEALRQFAALPDSRQVPALALHHPIRLRHALQQLLDAEPELEQAMARVPALSGASRQQAVDIGTGLLTFIAALFAS